MCQDFGGLLCAVTVIPILCHSLHVRRGFEEVSPLLCAAIPKQCH